MTKADLEANEVERALHGGTGPLQCHGCMACEPLNACWLYRTANGWPVKFCSKACLEASEVAYALAKDGDQ